MQSERVVASLIKGVGAAGSDGGLAESAATVVEGRNERGNWSQPLILIERGPGAVQKRRLLHHGCGEQSSLFELCKFKPRLPAPRPGVGRVVHAGFFLAAAEESEWIPPFV